MYQKRFDAADNVFSYQRRREHAATLGVNSMLPIRDLIRGWNDSLNLSLAASVTKTTSNVDKFKSTRGEITLNLTYNFGGE